MGIIIDSSSFDAGMKRFEANFKGATKKGLNAVSLEILRLSQFQVPHDTGALQNTGHTEEESDGYIVGYNKVYAAKLHEHPEYNFKKGRKGKYLEDPIKHNLNLFRSILSGKLQGAFK